MHGPKRRPPLPKRPAASPPKAAVPQAPKLLSPTFESRLGWALLITVHAAWIVTLACGIYLHDGRKADSLKLPLHHFDALFRAWGSVLVLAVVGARFMAGVLLPGLYRMPEVLAPAVLYGMQAGLRYALYQLHMRGLIFNPKDYDTEVTRAAPHVMSDHILLAAAAVSGLASEVLHPLLALRRQPRTRAVTVEKVFVIAHMLLSLGLATLVCGESFYTARYFHPPLENIIAGLAGALLFQAPMLLFNATAIRSLKTVIAAKPTPVRRGITERDALLQAVKAPPTGLAVESQH